MEDIFKYMPPKEQQASLGKFKRRRQQFLTYIGGVWYIEDKNNTPPKTNKRQLITYHNKEVDQIQYMMSVSNGRWCDSKFQIFWKSL